MAGVSAVLTGFSSTCSRFIPAAIAAKKLANNPELRVKYGEMMANMIADIKVKRLKHLDKALKDLDNEGTK